MSSGCKNLKKVNFISIKISLLWSDEARNKNKTNPEK